MQVVLRISDVGASFGGGFGPSKVQSLVLAHSRKFSRRHVNLVIKIELERVGSVNDYEKLMNGAREFLRRVW